MTPHPHRLPVTIACSIALSSFGLARVAQACGGTFCDQGPSVMPVDQTGENILFVARDGVVEAHVQIQYEGDPAKFAWIVPVLAAPEIEVGSDRLFQELLAATVPTFTLSTRTEPCEEDEPVGCVGTAESVNFFGQNAAAGGDDSSGENPPTVIDKGTAGAFQFVVLQGRDVDGVVEWLNDNGYAQDEDAPPILAEYLEEGFLLLAFRMIPGTTNDEIHPVVIRYEGPEACVPIRLTRIAANEDMGLRVFFLDDARVVPTNYRSVAINPFLIDWTNSNYTSVVTLAVDSERSEGRGFVTEYAGPSSVVNRSGLVGAAWNAARFLELAPVQVVEELVAQELMGCVDGFERFETVTLEEGTECVPNHPILGGLLDEYLPVPARVDRVRFYGCPQCYESLIDANEWVPERFVEDFEERIVAPAEHAASLLQANPYLTRLFTTISPHEMTVDPLFQRNPGLPEVSSNYTATRVFACEGPDYIELDDGRRIALDPDGESPSFLPALAVDEFPMEGPPIALVDNEDAIDRQVDAWNEELGLDAQGCNCRISGRLGGAAWAAFVFGFLAFSRRRRRV